MLPARQSFFCQTHVRRRRHGKLLVLGAGALLFAQYAQYPVRSSKLPRLALVAHVNSNEDEFGDAIETDLLQSQKLASWFASQVGEMPERVKSYGHLGPLYFIAMATVAESFTLPVGPMMATSGYIFGMWLGVAVSLVATSLAASLQFMLCRTLLRPSMERFVAKYPRIVCVKNAVETKGFKIMFLMRLEPLFPSSLSNVAFGLSKVRYPTFLASVSGSIPYTCTLVSSASVLRDFFGTGPGHQWYSYALGALLCVTLLWVISDIALKAINEAVLEEQSATEKRRRLVPK